MLVASNRKKYSHRITIEYGEFEAADEDNDDPIKLIRVCDSVLLGTITPLNDIEPNLRVYSSYSDGTDAGDIGTLIWISNIITHTIPIMGSNPVIRGIIESIDSYLTWQLHKVFRDKKPGPNKFRDS